MRVLITGANRGIGLGLTERFLEGNAEVIATVRRTTPKAQDGSPLDALAKKAGTKLRILPLDVTQEESCKALDKALGTPNEGTIDVLVNNAGLGEEFTHSLTETAFPKLLSAFETNAVGPLRVTMALRERLRRPGAKIVNITSRMGSIADNSSGGAYAYRMSKAALNMATKTLALEWRSQGILAVVVHPGWVKTDMGGANAPTPVAEATRQIKQLIEKLTMEDTGKFLHAKGEELPW